MRQPYAMMIDLRGKPCLVVGGGKVAGRKVKTLIDAGAHVKVVSPAITPMIKYWALSRKVEWFARALRTRGWCRPIFGGCRHR